MQKTKNEWQISNNRLWIDVNEHEKCFFEFYDDTICRFCIIGNTEELSCIICNKTHSSCAINVTEKNNALEISNGTLTVLVALDTLVFDIFDANGRRILSTAGANPYMIFGTQKRVRFSLNASEKIYGTGQDPMAKLNLRGTERRMWNEWNGFRRSGNAGSQFLSSSEGYGIVLNNPAAARFAIGPSVIAEPSYLPNMAPAPWPWTEHSGETVDNQMAIISEYDPLDIFIICRKSMDDIQRAYVDLTGHSPLPPRWAFGFIQSKNCYRTQDELMSVANEYRRRKIPCDVLVIDWGWFKECGDVSWDAENWPDPEKMLSQLHEMGFRVLQAQHPYIFSDSKHYKEFKSKGYLNKLPDSPDSSGCPETFDHSNPEARKVWWGHVQKSFEQGIDGYWTDMGELERHPQGTVSYLGNREQTHNLYPLLWAKSLYEGQRGCSTERVFTLTRSSCGGIQRYGAALWSGDVQASWNVFKDQIVVGQGVCLSGQQYWCTDIGGFLMLSEFTPELYIRWFQWGVFCPLFRTHGTRANNEVWMFGNQSQDILEAFIALRYRLLPYIYSCAHKVATCGLPIMRAMCMDFADDSVAVEQLHQFMFGPALLVAPVFEKGARERTLYLPEGIWYDFWTGQRHEGKSWITTAAPLSRIPVYVRAGSIIPMMEVQQHTTEKAVECIELHTYAGKSGEFELYEDDGHTYSYENNQYAKTLIQVDENGEAKIAGVNDPLYIIAENRKYKTVVHGKKEDDPVFKDEIIEIDVDYTTENIWTVCVCIRIPLNQEAQIDIKLEPPLYWKIKSSPKEFWRVPQSNICKKIKGSSQFMWELYSDSEVAPLVSHLKLKADIAINGKTQSYVKTMDIGTGYATRWKLITGFPNPGTDGIDLPTEVEVCPNLCVYHVDNKERSWAYNDGKAFNCANYVQLPMPPMQANAEMLPVKEIGYAKCRVWSEHDTLGFIEASADPTVKIWFNGTVVFKSDRILLEKLIDHPITIKKGWNDVLIKIAAFTKFPSSGREYGFSFRILNEKKDLMQNLLYAY